MIRNRQYYWDARGRKWWYLFIPNNFNINSTSNNNYIPRALTEDLFITTLKNKLIITSTSWDLKMKKIIRYFTVFDHYLEFFNYQETIPHQLRCCFEKILGDFPQKPHFDIDIDLTKYDFVTEEIFSEIIENLIGSIDDVLIERNIEIDFYRDILVFISHDSKGAKKSSHVIVDHYCHSDHNEAKGFYQEVVKRMDTDYKIFVDSGVYSSKQDFRIV